MKLSLFSITAICGLISCTHAIPLHALADIDALVERAYTIADLAEREWIDLETRTGPFANANEREKERAKTFIDNAHDQHKLHDAATPSHLTGTYHQNGEFHLDRQQPVNAHGSYKVAVQKNAGNPSTIGQVVLNKNHRVPDKKVAGGLKHSVKHGKEVTLPGPKKAERIAQNQAAHEHKQQRNAQRHKEGMARASKGNFRKGNGKPSVTKGRK